MLSVSGLRKWENGAGHWNMEHTRMNRVKMSSGFDLWSLKSEVFQVVAAQQKDMSMDMDQSVICQWIMRAMG